MEKDVEEEGGRGGEEGGRGGRWEGEGLSGETGKGKEEGVDG